MDCGGRFPAVCMDFDHRPGEKKLFTVAAMVGQHQTSKRVLAEIAKCDVVCSNCHRIRTATRHQAGETATPLIALPTSESRYQARVHAVPLEEP